MDMILKLFCVQWSPLLNENDLENPYHSILASGDVLGQLIIWDPINAKIITKLPDIKKRKQRRKILEIKWIEQNKNYLLTLQTPSIITLWNINLNSTNSEIIEIWQLDLEKTNDIHESCLFFELNTSQNYSMIIGSDTGNLFFTKW
ncbi:hypothetical protein M0811_13946 [Anaeramoeba ignava]|uniref:Uncharacterized protein n=1 Tax=Anaeramoeba ignava TaxID=1746090 RepID=A0A9Q0LXX0_ANAIG|nr:hypothetical protein M0811_13946 [Anaeramoeba ignava]